MRKAIILGFILTVALGTAALATSRGPIVIRSDTDFTADNGVVSGSGTPDDPYIIAGWEIQVPKGTQYGVMISGTTASFILRGVKVFGAGDPHGAAFLLSGVRNGTIEDCLVQNSYNGIVISASVGIAMRDTYLFVTGRGLQVEGSSPEFFHHRIEATNMVNEKPIHYYYGLSDKVLDGIEAGSVFLANCRNVTLKGLRVEQGDGVTVVFSPNTTIEGADLFRNHGHGLFILSSPNTTVKDCPRIANSALSGISIWLSDGSRVEDCGVYGNQVGIYVNASDRVKIRGASLGGNALGILVTGASKETTIRDSLFFKNRTTIRLDISMGAVVERCAIQDADIGVEITGGATYPQVSDSTFIQTGYGLDILGSSGKFHDNLIAYSSIGIIFEEAYGKAFPTGNTVYHNVIYHSQDALYLGHETKDTWVYENLIWDCGRAARDFGHNNWAPSGRGNWYSTYQGKDEDGDGIGDEPVYFGGGGTDPAPLMSRDFYTRIPGLLGTLRRREITLRDGEGHTASVTALVADTAPARLIGFQGLPEEIARDQAILFSWTTPVKSGFWNRGVRVDLDLVFFDEEGSFLGKLTMPAGSEDRYAAKKPFTYALEVPTGKLDELGLTATPIDLVLP